MSSLLLLFALAAPDSPPALLGPRRDPERAEALKRFGGNEATEKAVAAALDWLSRHRGQDGLWDADGFPGRCDGKACDGIGKGQHGEEIPCPFDAAISALAALAFLGRGEIPEGTLEGLRAADPWSAALATQALAEAEALEGKGRFRDRAIAGAKALLAARQPDGGFAYAAGFRPGSDVPYTALCVQALAAARDAGLELPGDFAAGVDRFLASLEIEKGKLAYLKEGRAYGYTPTSSNAHAAAAIRELLGIGLEGGPHRAHRALVAAQAPEWRISFREVDVPGRGRLQVQVGNLSLYQWWYGTIASFHGGGGRWSGWFGALKTALLGHQRTDGCARGSWDPLGTYERQTGGRVLATALGALMLEQPYRDRPRSLR
jgi:hypothetical protein